MRPAFLQRLWIRLAAICAAAAVVPVLAAGLWTAARLEEDARRAAEARLWTEARLCALAAERFVERGRVKLQNLARLLRDRGLVGAARPASGGDGTSGDGGGGVPAATAATLAAQLNAQVDPPDLFLELQYYDAGPSQRIVTSQLAPEVQIAQQGALPADPGSFEPLRDNAGQKAVNEPLRTGRAAVGERLETHLGFPTVPVSVPVGQDGRGFGVLLGYLDLRGLAADLAALGESSAVTLRDAAGRTMVAAGTAPAPGDAVRAEVGMADLGWRAAAESSRSGVLAAAGAARRRAFSWTVAAGLLAVGLALAAAAWIGRPIRALTRAAGAMASGDLAARVQLRRRDEIGRLGEAFDRMAEAVQRLDTARSDFVATVSHELRTPLTSLRMSLDNLADGLLGDVSPRQQEALQRVRADADRLLAIVAAMLQLARLEAGAEPLRADACDLAAVAAAAREHLRAAAARRDVAVEIQGAGRARGDAALLQSAVANVLENAIRFSPAGGRVRVDVGPGRVTVRDQGPGIRVARPFDPFVRGEGEGGAAARSGVGLGLSIVRRLVELHGGRVEAHDDAGAVVTITLPEALP